MSETHVTYLIVVEPVNPVAAQWDDEKPEPLVYGCIELMSDGKRTLGALLTALEADDLIGPWRIEPYDPPSLITRTGVLLAITKELDTEGAQEVAQVWHNVVPETT